MIAIEDDPHALVDLERELVDRYGSHYQVECFGSAPDLRARLRQLAEDDADVALVLAAHRLAGTSGSELLDETRRLHPNAQRVLLIAWGDWGDAEVGEAIFDSIASGRIDHYLIRPSPPPDEVFHQAISGRSRKTAKTWGK